MKMEFILIVCIVLIQLKIGVLQHLEAKVNVLFKLNGNLKDEEIDLKTKRDIDDDNYLSQKFNTDNYLRQLKKQYECMNSERYLPGRCLSTTVSSTQKTTYMTMPSTLRPFTTTTTSAFYNDDTFTWTKIQQCRKRGFETVLCSRNLLNFLKAFDYESYNECKTSELKSLVCRIKVVNLIEKYENGEI